MGRGSSIFSCLSILFLARSQFECDCEHRNSGMALLCDRRNSYYLYLLFVMVVAHNFGLSMPSIAVLRAWLVIDITKFGMLLVTLLWLLVMKEPIVCDGSFGADILMTYLCVHGIWELQTKPSHWLILVSGLIIFVLPMMFCVLLEREEAKLSAGL